MSIFGAIVDKIVHYAGEVLGHDAQAAPHPASTTSTGGPAPSSPPTPEATPATATSAPAAAPLQSVDVGAVLTTLAEQKGGGLNWQTSIVDLLKLLDLDSSLAARKTLADELGVHVAEAGTAEENEALHAAVVAKLAENGGKLPASIKA